MSVNKVILVGNLGKDAEVRYAASGTAVCRFSLATNETFKNKAGDVEERTEWHSIVAFGRLAEICGEYLTKGRLCYIEGSIRSGKWSDRDGNKVLRHHRPADADAVVCQRQRCERKGPGR